MDKPKKTDHSRLIRLPNGGTREEVDWVSYAQRLNIYLNHKEVEIRELEAIIKRLNK